MLLYIFVNCIKPFVSTFHLFRLRILNKAWKIEIDRIIETRVYNKWTLSHYNLYRCVISITGIASDIDVFRRAFPTRSVESLEILFEKGKLDQLRSCQSCLDWVTVEEPACMCFQYEFPFHLSAEKRRNRLLWTPLKYFPVKRKTKIWKHPMRGKYHCTNCKQPYFPTVMKNLRKEMRHKEFWFKDWCYDCYYYVAYNHLSEVKYYD